jgi:hypothetical protein
LLPLLRVFDNIQNVAEVDTLGRLHRTIGPIMGVPTLRFYARRSQQVDILAEAAAIVKEGKVRAD